MNHLLLLDYLIIKLLLLLLLFLLLLHTSTTLHCINTGTYRTGININTQVPGMKTRFQFLFLGTYQVLI